MTRRGDLLVDEVRAHCEQLIGDADVTATVRAIARRQRHPVEPVQIARST